VREPAPIFSSGSMSDVQPAAHEAPPASEQEAPPAAETTVPMPEPASAAPAATEEAKPRRFGWWSKRG